MDIGTISLIVMLALIALLAIGMPLGFASAVLAVAVLVMKFEPALITNPMSFGDGMLTGRPGTGSPPRRTASPSGASTTPIASSSP